jgi:hypothetical protein
MKVEKSKGSEPHSSILSQKDTRCCDTRSISPEVGQYNRLPPSTTVPSTLHSLNKMEVKTALPQLPSDCWPPGSQWEVVTWRQDLVGEG